MSIQKAQSYFQQHLVVMKPNSEVAAKLMPKTLNFLHTVGLPISEELGFSFNGMMTLLPTGIIRLEPVDASRRAVCLDLHQNESIRWEDDADQGFINSSAEQFLLCVYEFEYYLQHVQAKEVFGVFYDPAGTLGKREKYAGYLQEKFKAIDPAVFEKGYYWPAFVEEIEQGL